VVAIGPDERAGWTIDATVRRGPVTGRGLESDFQSLEPGPGEPHARRTELVGGEVDGQRLAGRPIGSFVHITDLQLADLESPGRVEFLQQLVQRADLAPMLPSYRPHEIVGLHAVEAMVQTLNGLATGAVGPRPQFVITTGDNIDNQQWNELRWFFALMNGGDSVAPSAVGKEPEGTWSSAWHDLGGWQPEDPEGLWQRRWGYPTHPGLVARARQPITPTGLTVPWLTCYGNHDGLVQGRTPATPAYAEVVEGALKQSGLGSALEAGGPPPDFFADPTAFFTGPHRAVTADRERRLIDRSEYVQAHFLDGGQPDGHGFTPENAERGTAYYVNDSFNPVRVIVLDTTNPGGHVAGSIGQEQFRWLERRLEEVHGRHRDRHGGLVETGNADRLVVLCSHHGLPQLTNPVVTGDPFRPHLDDLPRVLGPDIEALVHRFPNVVLWVSGHTHRNDIQAHRSRWESCFWGVTTSALMDWPCQARLVELLAVDSGDLMVRLTMVDHAAAARPGDNAEGLWRLAAVHRELAANEPFGVGGKGAHGTVGDRNVELLVPAPFPLAGLAGHQRPHTRAGLAPDRS
jgi:metallophosphoesterase (TIGR03767 family)